MMAPKKRKQEEDGLSPGEAKAKAKSKAKAKAKAEAAGGAKPASLALPSGPLKRLCSKISHGLQSSDPDKKKIAAEAKEAYDSASQEDKISILGQLEDHPSLKYIPVFIRSRREEQRKTQTGVDDYLDKYQINKYLNYPSELLDEYVSRLPSKEHHDEVSKGMGMLLYHFQWAGANETQKTEVESRELSASTARLTTKQVDMIAEGTLASSSGPAGSGGSADGGVQITASAEYLAMQPVIKALTADHKKLQTSLSECLICLATLEANPAAECQKYHQQCKAEYKTVQATLTKAIDSLGIAKAIPASDVTQAEAMTAQMKELRIRMFGQSEEMKEFKTTCNKLVKNCKAVPALPGVKAVTGAADTAIDSLSD